MKRNVGRLMLAAALIGACWTIGQAQATQPDFELMVTAPGGQTRIECLRGCNLAWVQRGLNPRATPSRTFTFQCSADRCGSATVGGWIDK